MKYWALFITLACVYFTTGASGLSCLPCEWRNCTKPECDFSGYALDECGCCTICAKQSDEICGGLWNVDGTCDKNLTCNVTSDMNYSGGVCSDAECRAIIDVVFALEGSSGWTQSNLLGSIMWSQEMIGKIYEMYGACAHAEVMQFAGIGSGKEYVFPMNLDLCTNNNDCVERRLKNMTVLGHVGQMTFTTLFDIAGGRFPLSSRYGRSQPVIIVMTRGGTSDADLADAWATYAIQNEILTYAIRVGASDEELFNITGNMSRIFNPMDDLITQIWQDTVDTTETCDYPEEFTPCLSQSCEATCDDMFKNCPLSCDSRGCRCAEGYVRVSEANRTCVTYSGCNRHQCPPGETYFDCLQDCEPTCANPNPGCNGTCRGSGCGCAKFHVRHNGVCIPEMECNTTGSCGYGEEYHECSSPCTSTCDDPNPICATVCGPPKCECMAGYVRINGSCYPMDMCPKGNCSYGEEFRDCTINCPRTCDDPHPMCDFSCGTPKCVCKGGYLRQNGTCIPEDMCPKVCPHGEIYRQCAATCEPTCANPNPICIEICRLPGECQCMDGYVRENGKCIPITECSTANHCSYGEEFRNCSSSCTPTCDNPHPICPTVCGPARCHCKPGYVRLNGSCIPETMCPRGNCSYGEEFRNCSSYCTPTCDDPYPTCIESCGPPRCQCMKGYVWHHGMCMPEDMCPRHNCSYGEEFVQCSSYCTPTCHDPYPFCIQICGPPKCQCMSGYVRHNGTCIPQGYCPTNFSCEYPKIADSCASKCQPTCDNPNPWSCEQGCAQDPCVCPVDHVMLSEYDRRCVHQFECPTKVCSQECPSVDPSLNARELSRAWICHFQKWRCTTYQWKLSVEEWWYSSGCYAAGGDIEHRWRRLFECPHHVNITCMYRDQYEYDVDAFGCEIGRCRDGYYRDNNQFMQLWMAHQMKYQEKMQLYNEATSMCGRNLNVMPGCHSEIVSHAKSLSSNFLHMMGGIVLCLLFAASPSL